MMLIEFLNNCFILILIVFKCHEYVSLHTAFILVTHKEIFFADCWFTGGFCDICGRHGAMFGAGVSF